MVLSFTRSPSSSSPQSQSSGRTRPFRRTQTRSYSTLTTTETTTTARPAPPTSRLTLRRTLSSSGPAAVAESAVELGPGDRLTLPIASAGPDSRVPIADSETGRTVDRDHPDYDDDETDKPASEHSALIPTRPARPHEPSPVDDDDDSPYELVRANVAPTDDHTASINTPRMWSLALLFAFLGSATNLFFSLRYPSVSITPMVALLLAHPLGRLWDRLFKRKDDPAVIVVDGRIVGSAADRPRSRPDLLRLWLGQGEWNSKEHCCVFVSSNVSFGFAFATDVIVEQTQFYKQDFGIMYQILLILSTQILGYSVAGLTRAVLVQPTGMLWPQALNTASMFSTLHRADNEPANGWRVSKYRFFMYVCAGSAAFYFLPGLLFPALSYFNVLTWFSPDNVVLANLFGVSSGLGMFPVTFDWAQIAYIGSPLIVPLWAAANVVAGIGIAIWLLAPVLYYANVLFSGHLPIMSSSVFDNTGQVYDVARILTPDFLFDETGYQSYSRVFLPITYVLSYFGQFAGLAALLTNTACWHGREIWDQLVQSVWGRPSTGYQPVGRQPGLLTGVDVHNRLMNRYPDVPMWWYVLTGVSMAAVGIFVVEHYPIFLPWYGLLLALLICLFLFIPIAIVQAVANQHISIYLVCQLISGTFFPGKPVANMVFTTYGYITSTQAVKFSSDLKLGHYMKVPPRILFLVQLVATIVSSLTQLGVLNWMLSHIPNICTGEAINGFTCPLARVHFNGSILWGVVGPRRFFGADGLYRHLLWAFPVGAILPVLSYLAYRRSGHPFFRKLSFPVMLSALSWTPPATGLNFSVWALVCWLFNGVIKKRAHPWWSKYNMTLSAALDSGLAVGLSVIFFAIIYPGWMSSFHWWGTDVYKQGCDWKACPYKDTPPGTHFGPVLT